MLTTYYGLMKQAKQSGLLDKSERLYFVSDTFTINLIPQALLLLGWLACNSSRRVKCCLIISSSLTVVGFLVSNLGQEYVQSSHDSYGYYEPTTYHSPSLSPHYQPPLPYKANTYHPASSPSYSPPTSSYSAPTATAYIAPSDHQSTHTSSYILPSLTSYTIADSEDNDGLNTLSYGDTLGAEYRVKSGKNLSLLNKKCDQQDLYPIIQSRLDRLQREIRELKEANIIISQGELSNEGLQYSY